MRTRPPFEASLDTIREASQALYKKGGTPDELTKPIEQLLLTQITNQPRSLQKRIGPSEIGTPCEHCLAAKLAGWAQTQSGIPWASTVGTAIHALIEDFVANQQINTPPVAGVPAGRFRYYTEQTVTVGQIGGTDITGSIDLLDVQAGATVDWKCVAKTSLTKYKRSGPSEVYRVQAHLYAKGCNDAGIPVERVSICFLPRASNNFYERHWWTETYNPDIAAKALERANRLHANLTAMEAISKEARDQYITGLPRAEGCWDCARFPDNPGTPQTLDGVELDLPTG